MSRIISQDRLLKDVLRVLNNSLGTLDLSTEKVYTRTHDDHHNGTFEGNIKTFMLRDGGMVVTTDGPHGPMRFQDYFSGGQSPRVHNALKILALAIKLDNDDRPQR
ncbi:MAG: hypothetical protein WC819_04415 [Parcubacteria group bacterium]|jgi:hypothetical protein